MFDVAVVTAALAVTDGCTGGSTTVTAAVCELSTAPARLVTTSVKVVVEVGPTVIDVPEVRPDATVWPPARISAVPPESLVKTGVSDVESPRVMLIAVVAFAVCRLIPTAGATAVTAALASGLSGAPEELLTVSV